MATLLIIDDNESMREILTQTLITKGHRVLSAGDTTPGIKKLSEEPVDLVITDLRLPSGTGFDILQSVREHSSFIPVIVMTAYGTIETAVKAVREGAYDFITKPFEPDHLFLLTERALESQRLLTENLLLREDAGDVPPIIGKSSKLLETLQNAQKVASSRATVLLLGESGTGKELYARTIHQLSDRRNGPFVAVNCAAIPKELLESELFGHEKGAFTGATEKRIGKFEMAHQGTLFLDEIGEMDLNLQAKILRVLQGEPAERVGGNRPVRVDVRVVAASNRDLQEAIRHQIFREDLYYRLNVFPIVIPPLRERKEDIPALAFHFLGRLRRELKKDIQDISVPAMEILIQQPWKGNVRELENCMERACILCDGPVILPEHLGILERRITSPESRGSLQEAASAAARAAETRMIRQVLSETGGNKSRASEILQVSYKTLLTKIKDYGIE
ncbi:MAG: sigma-54-dependent Fis family transcriptional regulator [Nitrospirae bacterium]|nr:sigma-54-dependent Fis family transcriptional regulator [Nitrospirota bacterium]